MVGEYNMLYSAHSSFEFEILPPAQCMEYEALLDSV